MMNSMTEWIERVEVGLELDEAQIAAAVSWLVDEAIAADLKAEFLTKLHLKGETLGEIVGFVKELKHRSVQVPWPQGRNAFENVLDVCGTGGDRLNTFNISTTVALLCAAAGVMVAKHGNRAVTSRSGSADVLEALGIPITLSPEAASTALERHGFAFLFAPHFHPAFKGIARARSLCAARGQSTLFNFLGPLMNPAAPTVQLLGVSRPSLVRPMAQTLRALGLRRAMVVSGSVPMPDGQVAYLDELSTLGDSVIAEFHQDRGFCESRWAPNDLPLSPAQLADLAGGDAAQNAAIVEGVLRDSVVGPKLEAVLLNAGAALFLAGRAKSIGEGWLLAQETVRSGAAARKLDELRHSGLR